MNNWIEIAILQGCKIGFHNDVKPVTQNETKQNSAADVVCSSFISSIKLEQIFVNDWLLQQSWFLIHLFLHS